MDHAIATESVIAGSAGEKDNEGRLSAASFITPIDEDVQA